MKTTLLTEHIDGHEIVRGLGRAVIDPIQARALIKRETPGTVEYKRYIALQAKHKKIINALAAKVQKKRLSMQGKQIAEAVKESAEYKRFQKIKAQSDAKTEAGIKALSDAWKAYKLKEKAICGSDANVNAALLETREYKDWLQARETAQAEIKAAYQEILKKRRTLIESADIFFTPKAGEEIIADKEAELIRADLKALPEKSLLTKAGEVMEDRRGEVFFHQDEYSGEWLQSKVVALGEELPATGVFQKEMSRELQIEIAEQKEEMRLDALSSEERQAEFDQMLQSARREAVFLKSEKELDGMKSAQALKEVRDWIAEQRAELVEKYGITQ